MHDLRHIGDIKAEKVLVAGVSYGAADLIGQLLNDFPHNFKSMVVCGKVDLISKSPELASFVDSGKLELKPFIKYFKGGQRVEFEDSSELDDVDLVLWATGYQSCFPYFEQTGDSLFHGLLDIYCRRKSVVGSNGSKSLGPLFLHCVSAREPSLMFGGLVENTDANGFMNSL